MKTISMKLTRRVTPPKIKLNEPSNNKNQISGNKNIEKYIVILIIF
jgi:hypothetical protein